MAGAALPDPLRRHRRFLELNADVVCTMTVEISFEYSGGVTATDGSGQAGAASIYVCGDVLFWWS